MLRCLAKYGYSRDIGAGVYDVHSPVVPPCAPESFNYLPSSVPIRPCKQWPTMMGRVVYCVEVVRVLLKHNKPSVWAGNMGICPLLLPTPHHTVHEARCIVYHEQRGKVKSAVRM